MPFNIPVYNALKSKYKLATLLSGHNTKLNKDSIVSFGIPAYQSNTHLVTCPFAGECKNYCYAKRGHYVYNNVKSVQERRLLLTQEKEFVSSIITEVEINEIKVVRIHDSGDFYSKAYLQSWINIANECSNTIFYAYTKSHSYVDSLVSLFPSNFVIIKSEGSSKDSINYQVDRHARLFNSVVELILADYHLASISDKVAYESINHRIGLLYNFKSSLKKYAKEYAEFYDLDWVEVHNEWVIKSGSKKKLIVRS